MNQKSHQKTWTPYKQFYDALESRIDEDNDKPIEVRWDEMMKNLDVKIEKANHAKLKGTEFFKLGNLAQVGVSLSKVQPSNY